MEEVRYPRHPAPRRHRTRIAVAITTAGLCLVGWLFASFGLGHYVKVDYESVMITRFMLGRWPTSWEQVERATDQYGAYPPQHFSNVRLEAMPGDSCRVTFGVKDIFGFAYEETQVLAWSADREKRIAKEECHTFRARAIAREYYLWMVEKNDGRASADTKPVSDAIAYWSDTLRSRATITKTAITVSQASEPPRFIVQFSDGQTRAVVLERALVDEFY